MSARAGWLDFSGAGSPMNCLMRHPKEQPVAIRTHNLIGLKFTNNNHGEEVSRH